MGLTPLKRFYHWAGIADDGQPFEPAMQHIYKIQAQHKDLLPRALHTNDVVMAKVKETVEEVYVQGWRTPVSVFQRTDIRSERDLLCLSMPRFVPPALALDGVRRIARQVCCFYPVKFHVLTCNAFDPAFLRNASSEEVHDRVVEIVESMDINEEFVLW